jgi:hypothetical protein
MYLDSYFDANKKAHFFRKDGFVGPLLGAMQWNSRLIEEQKIVQEQSNKLLEQTPVIQLEQK